VEVRDDGSWCAGITALAIPSLQTSFFRSVLVFFSFFSFFIIIIWCCSSSVSRGRRGHVVIVECGDRSISIAARVIVHSEHSS